ncbi:GEM-like protein 1 [Linum grandiflorum]
MDHNQQQQMIKGNHPYVETVPVHPDQAPATYGHGPMGRVRFAVSRCGRRFEDVTKRAEDYADGFWRHLKTSPNLGDTAMARLAQGTKVIAEGGYEKVFIQTFGIMADEKLLNSYACYLSTSTGPVIGTLYVSTKKVAFCSDYPLSYRYPTGQQEWIYYKIMIRIEDLYGVNTSRNPSERYIQLLTVDRREFWFMGFISFDKAFKQLRQVLIPIAKPASTMPSHIPAPSSTVPTHIPVK